MSDEETEKRLDQIKGIMSGIENTPDLEDVETSNLKDELLLEFKKSFTSSTVNIEKSKRTFSLRNDIIEKLDKLADKSEGLNKSEIVEFGIEIIFDYASKKIDK